MNVPHRRLGQDQMDCWISKSVACLHQTCTFGGAHDIMSVEKFRWPSLDDFMADKLRSTPFTYCLVSKDAGNYMRC